MPDHTFTLSHTQVKYVLTEESEMSRGAGCPDEPDALSPPNSIMLVSAPTDGLNMRIRFTVDHLDDSASFQREQEVRMNHLLGKTSHGRVYSGTMKGATATVAIKVRGMSPGCVLGDLDGCRSNSNSGNQGEWDETIRSVTITSPHLPAHRAP